MIIALQVKQKDRFPPSIRGGSVRDGGREIDPQILNARGIIIQFNEPVEKGMADITRDGRSLGWTVEWREAAVFLRVGNGVALNFQTVYIITIKVADLVGNVLETRLAFATKGI